MKIADDIRTVVEHEPSASNIIDIIALATMDRDFRPIVDTAQRRGKKVVVLGLEGGLSRELEGAASEVRFLNKFLKLPQPGKQGMGKAEPPRREDAAFMMRIAAWMQSNRWRFVYRDRLEGEFGGQATETEILKKLIADGWLVPSSNSPVDAQGQARSLEPNQDHIAARAAYYLSRWIPARVDFCLNKRGMPHVDINYLASGMARDTTLVQMNVGQTRADAESWLYAAASAGLVVAQEQPHPQAPTKIITTWRLPEEEVTTSPTTEATEVMRDTSIPTSSYLRHLLTQKLNDSELTRLLFDHFRPVHREVEGAPKFARIQALLDYVERSGLHQKLMAAIREINSALSEESPTQPLAA